MTNFQWAKYGKPTTKHQKKLKTFRNRMAGSQEQVARWLWPGVLFPMKTRRPCECDRKAVCWAEVKLQHVLPRGETTRFGILFLETPGRLTHATGRTVRPTYCAYVEGRSPFAPRTETTGMKPLVFTGESSETRVSGRCEKHSVSPNQIEFPQGPGNTR